MNINGKKFEKIEDKLFKKIFDIKEINNAEIFNIDNRYYVGELNSIDSKNLNLENKDVQLAITSQLKIKNKLYYEKNFVNDCCTF